MSDPVTADDPHPCLSCGACCATYRVSFYWADADAHGLPPALTRWLTSWHACMAGTQAREPRCEALEGRIGHAVACRVYGQRPSPCRELQPGDDKCQRARGRHALPPLALHDAIVVPGVVDPVPALPSAADLEAPTVRHEATASRPAVPAPAAAPTAAPAATGGPGPDPTIPARPA